jgi:hypothetical protein
VTLVMLGELAVGCVVSPSGGCLPLEAHPLTMQSVDLSGLLAVRRVSFRRLSPSGGPPQRLWRVESTKLVCSCPCSCVENLQWGVPCLPQEAASLWRPTPTLVERGVFYACVLFSLQTLGVLAAGCVVSPSGGCLPLEAHPFIMQSVDLSGSLAVRRVSLRRLSPSGGPPQRLWSEVSSTPVCSSPCRRLENLQPGVSCLPLEAVSLWRTTRALLQFFDRSGSLAVRRVSLRRLSPSGGPPQRLWRGDFCTCVRLVLQTLV